LPLSAKIRVKDVKEVLQLGNHKGAEQQQDLLKTLVKDRGNHDFALPLPLDKISYVSGVLLAPLDVQLQKTMNKCSKIIPKNRLTHDQSWKW
jgi:hypothetical protein